VSKHSLKSSYIGHDGTCFVANLREEKPKMAVHIRLSRIGTKHRPFFRVVAVDSRRKRDGSFLELFGTYDAIKSSIVTLKPERIDEWVKKGAQCTAAVKRILKSHRLEAKKAAA
jgi:small subunit ribosomal protein S16